MDLTLETIEVLEVEDDEPLFADDWGYHRSVQCLKCLHFASLGDYCSLCSGTPEETVRLQQQQRETNQQLYLQQREAAAAFVIDPTPSNFIHLEHGTSIHFAYLAAAPGDVVEIEFDRR